MEVSSALPKQSIRREALIVAVLSAVAVAALLLVFALVSRFRDWRSRLADRTYRHGRNELAFGSAGQAIEYFRSALFFDPDNFDYQFSLAQALENAGRFDEAEAYLRNLWEREPQSGSVNVQLARLAEHRGETRDVLRYYHNAIYGIWRNDPDQNRRMARVELVNFLLAQHDTTQAQSELIAMQAGLPADPQLHMQLGELFMRLPDYEHALAEFRQARQLDRQNPQSAAQAGIAAFHLGWFRTAIHFLGLASKAGDHDETLRNMLDTASLVVASNPRARGLSIPERTGRVQNDFQVAKQRLQDCRKVHGESGAAAGAAVQGDSNSLDEFSTQLADISRLVRRVGALADPNNRDEVMDFVFGVEEQTKTVCGAPVGRDLALLLLGRSQEAAER
jgi:Flp pilus assembly protein TadD